MDSISPVYLLLAAIVCSMVGRMLLIRAAWEISKPWGLAVLFVPLAPMFFRMNYKELAGEGQHWRTATTIFAVAFFAVTGSSGSVNDLWTLVPEKFRPKEVAEHQAAPPEELLAEAADGDGDEDARAEGESPVVLPATRIIPAEKDAAPAKKGFMGRILALVRPSSTSPDPAKPAAGTPVATLTPPLIIGPTLAERVAANQQEFARLGVVYERLKKERGYLKKWDQEAIKGYNEQAAKYQADLAKARADQTELNKQFIAKK